MCVNAHEYSNEPATSLEAIRKSGTRRCKSYDKWNRLLWQIACCRRCDTCKAIVKALKDGHCVVLLFSKQRNNNKARNLCISLERRTFLNRVTALCCIFASIEKVHWNRCIMCNYESILTISSHMSSWHMSKHIRCWELSIGKTSQQSFVILKVENEQESSCGAQFWCRLLKISPCPHSHSYRLTKQAKNDTCSCSRFAHFANVTDGRFTTAVDDA